MRIITRQNNAKGVAKRWGKVYNTPYFRDDEGKQGIHKALVSLGDSPDPDEVNNVIGNSSWTTTTCDNCNTSDIDVIEIGQALDYESSTANVCLKCLKEAVNLLNGDSQ